MPVVTNAVIISLCGSFYSTMRLKESQVLQMGSFNCGLLSPYYTRKMPSA